MNKLKTLVEESLIIQKQRHVQSDPTITSPNNSVGTLSDNPKKVVNANHQLSKEGIANTMQGTKDVFANQARDAAGVNANKQFTEADLPEILTEEIAMAAKKLMGTTKTAIREKEEKFPSSSGDTSSHYQIQKENPTRNPRPGHKELYKQSLTDESIRRKLKYYG